MNAPAHFQDLLLQPADNERLANLCGQLDEHLRQIERRLGVEINNRGHQFRVIGEPPTVTIAMAVLVALACNITASWGVNWIMASYGMLVWLVSLPWTLLMLKRYYKPHPKSVMI